MIQKLQKLLDRIESRIALWTIVQGSGIVTGGVVSGWIASAEAWLDSYGALGWWFAALSGAVLTGLVFVAFAYLRQLWVQTNAMREWAKKVDNVNPLESEFKNKRLMIQDLANPITDEIADKSFIDCELIGPCGIFLTGNTQLTFSGLINCEIVIVPVGAPLKNQIVMRNVTIFYSQIFRCTLFVSPVMIPTLLEMKADIITFTGDEKLDLNIRKESLEFQRRRFGQRPSSERPR